MALILGVSRVRGTRRELTLGLVAQRRTARTTRQSRAIPPDMHGRLNIAFVALTVAIGGFLLGFDSNVISGVSPFIRDYFSLTGESGDLQLGWAVSSLGWGALLGNAVAGALSDRFGRRGVLLVTALLFVCSSLLAALATTFVSFVSARLIGGLAVGCAILIAPVYIAEISPAEKRGSLVSLNQLMIVIGISA